MQNNASSRILSIDIMRGLTLFLMLFVNDLYEPGVPHWLVHAKADHDGMGLADWVFPGFLFMVGMAVPYAVSSRQKRVEASSKIILHIFLRAFSLLLIGFFVINGEEYLNSELTGINHLWWLTIAYVCFFLIWNNYPKNNNYKRLFAFLKFIGVAGLAVLAFVFRSGKESDPGWMHIGWWGILGLIGWGYLVAAVGYFFIKDRLLPAIILWIIFILLNVLSKAGMLGFLTFLNPVLGVIIDGNVPSIVLAGMVLSILLRGKLISTSNRIFIIALLGAFYVLIGFVLRNWFIISKIQGTPSWAMICNGISMLLFALLYYIVDIKNRTQWTYMFSEAGKNSLTTYLTPDVIYFVTWALGIPLYFYKQHYNAWLAVGGSLGWAFIMIWLVILLSKINIRLKL